MKRVRKNLALKTERTRRNVVEEDSFIARYKGQNHLDVLKDFLNNRKENVNDNYPKQKSEIILLELNLYEEILNRVIKGFNQKLLT